MATNSHPGKDTGWHISNTPKGLTVLQEQSGGSWVAFPFISNHFFHFFFNSLYYQQSRSAGHRLPREEGHSGDIRPCLILHQGRFTHQLQGTFLKAFPRVFRHWHFPSKVPGNILANKASMSQNDFSSSLVMMMRYPAMKFIPWNKHRPLWFPQILLRITDQTRTHTELLTTTALSYPIRFKCNCY